MSFNSTKGLILGAIAMISMVTAVWSMLSGPMAEMGVREIVVKALGMKIVQAEREGRIIILYHSIAMAIIAIETYLINGLLKIKPFYKTAINAIITVGYLVTMIFGMGFAYFGHNWAFHGLYIFGLSLIFFAGVLLIIALWPWNPEYYVTSSEYSHTRGGLDLERIAFFATALTTVLSSLFGAVPGSAPSGSVSRLFGAEARSASLLGDQGASLARTPEGLYESRAASVHCSPVASSCLSSVASFFFVKSVQIGKMGS